MMKKGRSKVWAYSKEVCKEALPTKHQWFCYGCYKHGKIKLMSCQSTSAVLRHLKQSHRIGVNMRQRAAASPLAACIRASSLFFGFDLDRFQELHIRWIVFCHIAFYQIENSYFRDLLAYFNPKMALWIPQAAKTVRK